MKKIVNVVFIVLFLCLVTTNGHGFMHPCDDGLCVRKFEAKEEKLPDGTTKSWLDCSKSGNNCKQQVQ